MSKVEVVPHNPKWIDAFADEARLIQLAVGDEAVAIHHIGSTSIPGIYAKPVIDILLEVHSVEALNAKRSAMESLGYEALGEFGIAGRRYFRKDDAGTVRTHQVHAFEAGSDQIARHLAFRDYLIADPAEAYAYSELKQNLAKRHAADAGRYIGGKDDFIKQIDRKAAQ